MSVNVRCEKRGVLVRQFLDLADPTSSRTNWKFSASTMKFDLFIHSNLVFTYSPRIATVVGVVVVFTLVADRTQIDHQLVSDFTDPRLGDVRQKMFDEFGLAGLTESESIESESLEQ